MYVIIKYTRRVNKNIVIILERSSNINNNNIDSTVYTVRV